eukprot:scaffold291610_cov32-Tisochrysis_lutea.AAC.1
MRLHQRLQQLTCAPASAPAQPAAVPFARKCAHPCRPNGTQGLLHYVPPCMCDPPKSSSGAADLTIPHLSS